MPASWPAPCLRSPGWACLLGSWPRGSRPWLNCSPSSYRERRMYVATCSAAFSSPGGWTRPPSMPSEAMRQLLLRYQLAMNAADSYVRAGYSAVVQDVIVGPVLTD